MTGARRRRSYRGAAIDRGPRPLGESLDDVVAGLWPGTRQAPGSAGGSAPAPSAAAVGSVFSRWEELVGTGVARHTRPRRLGGGTLVVEVDQPAWATQVRLLAPRILARLGETTGDPIERLEVVVRRTR
jgi:hypothetical protein